jgi:hypothetical protein
VGTLLKKQLGQFYTKNSDYILSNLSLPHGITVVEPFVGEGDLLQWISLFKPHNVEVYDIDPKVKATHQDTLLSPPNYKGKYVVTNPPYLAKNKNKDKTIYEKYNVQDLYKAFLKTVVEGEAEGGVVIVPLNFLCDRDNDIRSLFFEKYKITKMNMFEEQVFDDTSYTVCSFSFEKGFQDQPFTATIFPSREQIEVEIDKKYGYRIGGELYKKVESEFKFGRLTLDHKSFPSPPLKYDLSKDIKPEDSSLFATPLYIYAIDSGTQEGRIRLEVDPEPFYGKDTDRAFATITCNKPILDPHALANKFNELLEERRQLYRSLFLTNYRNSTKHYARKRISFGLVFNFLKEIV